MHDPAMPSATDAARRFLAIDRLKAIAIVGVIVDHALPPTFAPLDTRLERVLRWAVQFHVPTFLLVSGFLYSPAGLGTAGIVGRRLARVLVPYLVASAVMILAGVTEVGSLRQVPVRLLTGSVLPIYYFVFLLTLSICITAVVSRLGRHAMRLTLAALWLYPIAAMLWEPLRLAPLAFPFWGMRNPLYYHGYFVAGWVAREEWPRLARFAAAHPWLVRAACVIAATAWAVFCGLGAPGPRAASVFFRILYTLATVGLVASLTADRPATRPVQLLSAATYTIFLYHLPFITTLRPYTAGWAPAPRTIVGVAAGLAGGVIIATAGARVLGRRARLVLGM